MCLGQLYKFIDKSGSCFDNIPRGDTYNELLSRWLKQGRTFSVGDMLAFRDVLIEYGFKWGTDFYAIKVTE